MVTDGAGTSLADRPLARRLKAFLEQEYKVNAVTCLFHVNNTETRLVETSRRNDSMALATGAFLMRLFTFFTNPKELKTKEICIAIPYQAQIKAYTDMLATLDKVPAWYALKLGKISVSTIDSVQGMEWDLVLGSKPRNTLGLGHHNSNCPIHILQTWPDEQNSIKPSTVCLSLLIQPSSCSPYHRNQAPFYHERLKLGKMRCSRPSRVGLRKKIRREDRERLMTRRRKIPFRSAPVLGRCSPV